MKQKIKTKLYNLFTSDIKDEEYALLRKVIMINAFFVAGMVAFFSFSVINAFLTNRYVVSILDFIAFAVFLYSFLDLRKSKNIHKASVVGSVLLILFMLLFTLFNHNYSFGLIWTIFVPIFSISLFGSKTGLRISILFYTVLFALLLFGVYAWDEESWDLTSFLRLAFASSVLVFVIYTTENSFEKISKKLNKQTYTDSLTSLYNRRKIDEIAEANFYDFNRYKTPLCIAVIDIDDFKDVNDSFGHAVGDSTLVSFSKILLDNSRKTDRIGRWGGEEFIFIIQNTELEDAVKHLDNIRKIINSYKFDKVGQVTCSIGISKADENKDTVDKLFKAADKALYISKNSGKDMVSTI